MGDSHLGRRDGHSRDHSVAADDEENTTRPRESLTTEEGSENLGFKDVPGSDSDGEGSDYTVAMDTQINILESDRIALGVINNLHLEQNRLFAGKWTMPPPKLGSLNVDQIDHEREAALLKLFHDATTVRSVRNTRLIQITFRSPDPVLAAAVVNNMVNTYVEDNYRTRYESTMQASDWLAKQISDLQLRVETGEAGSLPAPEWNSGHR